MNGNFSQIACACILFLATLSACSNEQQIDLKEESCQGNHQIALSLKAVPEISRGTRAVSVPVDEGNGAGYKVKDFVIFQFDQNGNRLVDPKYYEYNPGESGQTIPIMLPTEDGIEYTIVVLANFHNKLADIVFADATTLDKLMEKYQKFEKLEDSYKYNGTGYDLLMNGYTTINKNTSSLNVELYRNVAKFTLTITNPATSGVILNTAQVKSVPTKIDYFYHLLEDKKPTALTAPYPTHNKFTTFDYPIDEFEVRPGDGEKVLTYYLPCHLMGTNTNSISEKTKGNYAPDYATFIELYGVSVDGSTYTRYRFYLGDNWTNDYNIKPNYHYQLPIKFSSIGDPQADTRVQHVGGFIEEPDANSYIINPLPIEEQQVYKIPVARRINTFWINEQTAGNIPSSTAYTIINNTKWAAEIIWQTSDKQLIQFCDKDGNITSNNGRSTPTYTGLVPLCLKPMPGAKGNAIIGVYSTDNPLNNNVATREYSWSWHLWITEYNPDECRNQNWDGRYQYVLSNGVGKVVRLSGSAWDTEDAKYYNKWMMDRNLGALSNEGNTQESIGFIYQYGRKDPFQFLNYPHYSYNKNSDKFEVVSKIQNKAYSDENTLDYTIKSPYIFIYGSKLYAYSKYHTNKWDNPDWNMNEAGSQKKKSFLDPCPPGWRIPESDAWKDMFTSYTGKVGVGHVIYCDKNIGSENTVWIPHGGCVWNTNSLSSCEYNFIIMHTENNSPTTWQSILSYEDLRIEWWKCARNGSGNVRPIRYDEEADE